MINKSKRQLLKPILILVTLLVLPGFLYYMLTLKGENRYKPLPFFGEKKLTGTFHSFRGKKIADTLYHRVLGYSFQNQDGEMIADTTYQNKIKVVNFYSEDCKDGCSRVMHAMSRADSNYSKNPMVQFLSINVLKSRKNTDNFIQKYQPKAGKWDLLYTQSDALDTVLKKGFLVDGGLNNGEPLVSTKVVLLDFQNRIRGFYEGTFKPDLDRLNDEIKVLIVEQLRNEKD